MDYQKNPSKQANEFTDENESGSSYDATLQILNQSLKDLPKGRSGQSWGLLPQHNMVINGALMGINFWKFTILPRHAHKRCYQPAKGNRPEGIVLEMTWNPTSDVNYPYIPKVAELAVTKVTQEESILETVKREFRDIEIFFGIDIPSSIKSKILAEVPKVAARRWGAKGNSSLVLVPFDGSKPFKVSLWTL